MGDDDPPLPLTQADIPTLVQAVAEALKRSDGSGSSTDPPGKLATV